MNGGTRWRKIFGQGKERQQDGHCQAYQQLDRQRGNAIENGLHIWTPERWVALPGRDRATMKYDELRRVGGRAVIADEAVPRFGKLTAQLADAAVTHTELTGDVAGGVP